MCYISIVLEDDIIAALPAQTAARFRSLRAGAREPRTDAEWSVHRRRMAEIQTNLAIENMPLTESELAFFDLAFALNVAREDESALLRLWNTERVQQPILAAE